MFRLAPRVGTDHSMGPKDAEKVVLQMSGASLLHAETLESLRNTGASLHEQGIRLVVVCGDYTIRRLLTATGFTKHFELAETAERAAA